MKKQDPQEKMDRSLHVLWTTPHGLGGTGGMDRITQLVSEACSQSRDHGVVFDTLTTKGRWGRLVGVVVFIRAVMRLTALIIARRVDVLHVNTAAYGSCYRKMILAAVARWFRVPYVVHVHSGRFIPFWTGARPFLQRRLHAFFDRAAVVIVLGREFESLVLEKVPSARGRVRLLYNATPAPAARERPSVANPRLHLSTLGLLGENKNTTLLIEVLGSLAGRGDWVATVAGNGEVERARAQVAALGLSHRISIPGWIDRGQVHDLLAQTDIFLLPSRSEGLPMAILEAFSYGIAVIATPVNAIPEVIESGRNGLLVPVNDASALAAAITRLLDDTALRRRLGNAALTDHAQRYDISAFVRVLRDVWQQAARDPPVADFKVKGRQWLSSS